MYSIKVEPHDGSKRVITRRMSSNNAMELIPTVVEICKAVYGMVDPVALHIRDNVYRVFDIDVPHLYAKVTITKDDIGGVCRR